MARARRAVIIGLDAASPKMLERFVEEGALPNIGALMREGAYSKLLPPIPPQTPAGWFTLATGAWPGTHGVTVWGAHLPGEPVERTHGEEAFHSGLCRAELIWEAAARAGRRSVVIYYPGWPPTTDMAVHIDWLYQPGRFFFEIAPAECYIGGGKAAKPGAVAVEVGPANGWSRPLPRDAMEAVIPVAPHDGEPVRFYALVLPSEGRLELYRSKSTSNPVVALRPGEWSGWIEEEFTIRGEAKRASVRFKLLHLADDGFALYRSQVYPLDGGFVLPRDVGERLVRSLGPYVNEGVFPLWLRGLVDERTLREEMSYRTRWIADAIGALVPELDPAIVILHWHPIDAAQHLCTGKVDPEGGDYDPESLDRCWAILRTTYQLADELVGEVASRTDPSETVLCVVSDHGTPPNRRAVSLFNLLRQHGLVEVKEVNGRLVPDWRRSKVFYSQNHLWVNLKGRERDGVVGPEEYDDVVRTVIRLLRDLKDPETGEHVFALVLRREDAAMVGLFGPTAGDVVFVYERGYRWSGPEVLQLGEGRVVFPSGGANHGPQPPTYETGVSSNYAILILSGPGVRRGYVRDVREMGPAKMVDVAPTVAHLVGIPEPAQSEGCLLKDMLEDGAALPERKFEPLPWTVKPRRPRKVTLAGDVTDEEL